MNAPARDSLITIASLKVLGVFLAVGWFLWPTATGGARESGYEPFIAATICWAGWRLYRWHWHPFSEAASAWNDGERGRFIQRQLAQRDRLLKLSPQLFEDASAQLLHRHHGWDVQRTRYSGDGGWDVSVDTKDGRILVECKQYRPGKPVGRPALQKLHSAMVTEGVRSGILITTSSFSEPARTFAARTSVQLIDGVELSHLMRAAYGDGPQADVVYTMCTRCGALVEFKAGLDSQAICLGGHRVMNESTHLFKNERAANRSVTESASTASQSVGKVPERQVREVEREGWVRRSESDPVRRSESRPPEGPVRANDRLRQWQDKMYRK